MRRYGIIGVMGVVMLLVVLRSVASTPVQAAAPLGVSTPTSTATSTGTPTATATATATGTTTQTPTLTSTPTRISTPTKTSTIGFVFPIILKQPTLTPTPTWTPSQTATAFNCSGRFDGSINLEDNKPTYATFIEWIKFLQWVHNNNNSTTCFGVLGFAANRPDGSPYPFNSQWSASGVPSKHLTINANCWGPNGQPCAGSQASGQQEDHMGTGNYIVNQEGQYTVVYWVCYSNFNVCTQSGGAGDWEQLGSIQFTAINWTPTPPSIQSGTEIAPTPTTPPSTGPLCYLITNDPRGIYLNCNTPQLKERQLFHT